MCAILRVANNKKGEAHENQAQYRDPNAARESNHAHPPHGAHRATRGGTAVVNDPFAQHAADFVRYDGQYVISCSCGYKSATTVRKQAVQRCERHNGVRYIEPQGPDVVLNDPNVQAKERMPRMVEAAKGMSPGMLERANVCADCGGTLRDAKGSYGIRFDRETTKQWPVCVACKTARLVGEVKA